MVFLRPIVIRDNNQSQNLSSNRYDYIRQLQIDSNPAQQSGRSSAISPLLPEMVDGVVTSSPQLPPSDVVKRSASMQPAAQPAVQPVDQGK